MSQATLSTTSHKPRYDGMPVSPQAYLKLEDDGFKYDMIDGVLHVAPSADSGHSHTQVKLTSSLDQFAARLESYRVFVELDVHLPDSGDVLRPDLIVLLPDNHAERSPFIRGVPDVIVEILSPSTSERDLGPKSDRYLANGVKEYWTADPETRRFVLRQNGGDRWISREGSGLASEVLPGFSVTADAIFPARGKP